MIAHQLPPVLCSPFRSQVRRNRLRSGVRTVRAVMFFLGLSFAALLVWTVCEAGIPCGWREFETFGSRHIARLAPPIPQDSPTWLGAKVP